MKELLLAGVDDHLCDLGRSCGRLLHVNHRLAVFCQCRAIGAGRNVLRPVSGGTHLQLAAAGRLLLDHADYNVRAVRRYLPRGAAAAAAGRGEASAPHRHADVGRRRRHDENLRRSDAAAAAARYHGGVGDRPTQFDTAAGQPKR